MRILLLGRDGHVGWELRRTLLPLGELTALGRQDLDLSDPDRIREVIGKVRPDLIVNAAAYTDVDRAENEPDLARAVNVVAVGVLAEESLDAGAALVHYSTDYVFDGSKGGSYDEQDEPKPLNVYGQTKLEGEHAIQAIGGAFLILRTSWVYSLRRESFVTKVLRWAREQEIVRVVADQTAGPTWARTLAEATSQVISQGVRDIGGFLTDRAGIYHLAGAGSASRYEWARAILELDPRPEEQVVNEILPAESTEFSTPALRPRDSTLDCTRFESHFGVRLPSWAKSLELALSDQLKLKLTRAES